MQVQTVSCTVLNAQAVKNVYTFDDACDRSNTFVNRKLADVLVVSHAKQLASLHVQCSIHHAHSFPKACLPVRPSSACWHKTKLHI